MILPTLSIATKSFGPDVTFNLEAVSEDDDSSSLYAIALWKGAEKVHQPGLTFTYELT